MLQRIEKGIKAAEGKQEARPINVRQKSRAEEAAKQEGQASEQGSRGGIKTTALLSCAQTRRRVTERTLRFRQAD